MTLNDGRFFIFHSFITGVCSWIFHCSYADDVAVVVVAADAVIVEDVAVVLLLFLVDIDNDYREPKFGSTDIWSKHWLKNEPTLKAHKTIEFLFLWCKYWGNLKLHWKKYIRCWHQAWALFFDWLFLFSKESVSRASTDCSLRFAPGMIIFVRANLFICVYLPLSVLEHSTLEPNVKRPNSFGAGY